LPRACSARWVPSTLNTFRHACAVWVRALRTTWGGRRARCFRHWSDIYPRRCRWAMRLEFLRRSRMRRWRSRLSCFPRRRERFSRRDIFHCFNKEHRNMPSIKDLTIVNSNTAEARPVESGTEVTLCSPDFCGSKNLSVYKRTIFPGRKFDVQAGNDYNLIYVIAAPIKGIIRFKNEVHDPEEG